jgi:serine/threonine-protein kinase
MRSQDFSPGDRIPGTKFVVVRKEGEGGHGALYLVRNINLPEAKRFALKILHADVHARSTDLAERMLREAHVLALIEHPNVVSVLDTGLTEEDEPRPWVLMERLRGRTLRKLLDEANKKPLGAVMILSIAIEVCDALDCAHTKHGVIHRDIKPDNIFLHNAPNDIVVVKVIDFGVVHLLGIPKRQTGRGVFIGTPRYASPEQLQGVPPTPQADLYALGLVLYEMLTAGRGPFDDIRDLLALGRAHIEKAPPRPSEFTPYAIDHELEELVMALLNKEPKTRPASAAQIASKLRAIKNRLDIEHGAVAAIDPTYRTEETPLENIMRGVRANQTDSGRASSDISTSPAAPLAHRFANPDATEEIVLSPPIEGRTLETVPLRQGTTMQSAAPFTSMVGTAQTPRMGSNAIDDGIDRRAITREIAVDTPRVPHHGTDPMDAKERVPFPGELAISSDKIIAGKYVDPDLLEPRVSSPVTPRPAAGVSVQRSTTTGGVAASHIEPIVLPKTRTPHVPVFASAAALLILVGAIAAIRPWAASRTTAAAAPPIATTTIRPQTSTSNSSDTPENVAPAPSPSTSQPLAIATTSAARMPATTTASTSASLSSSAANSPQTPSPIINQTIEVPSATTAPPKTDVKRSFDSRPAPTSSSLPGPGF